MRFGIGLIALLAATSFPANSFAQADVESPMRLMNTQFRATGSYLGVRLADINPDRAKALKLGEPRGVEIARVEPGSPAEEAGIKPGDVLLTYNGENILGAQQLGRLVAETPQGRKIRLQYWRDGRTETTTVTTGSPPPAFEFPSGRDLPRFDFPEMHAFSLPVPLVVWKDTVLGIECEQLGEQLGQYFGVKDGALVRSVEGGSAAEKGGVKAGDVITAIGDQAVTSPRDVTAYTRMERQPPKNIAINIIRNHKALKLNIPAADQQ
ncbi:MAG TPA: PDZ domain-containing protein [Bryobacteraceae bacterium]|jgi:serine protease Do